MKKLLSIIGFVAIASFFIGCDDFLEEDAETFFNEEQVFSTENGIEAAVNGLYQSYSDPGYHGSSIHTFINPISGKF